MSSCSVGFSEVVADPWLTAGVGIHQIPYGVSAYNALGPGMYEGYYFEPAAELDPSPSSRAVTPRGPVVCGICGKSFCGDYRKGNLARHRRQKHGEEEQSYPCEESYCSRVFKRQDARLKHYRKQHHWRAPQPPQPRKMDLSRD